ncbi:META domain-containing protein [Deinococcus sp. MIMF12]|uniref:META domain-containing protein n=1 Tax=Deinococcus rhizophilus TaxID=3049544 RepID=A0ABT7JHP5_9DEIO|nr:META domain-containing protein [Deinococcus rhizophilus]MDL2344574.1 META domain-containing protein [Deinococcus rhizophilus]
MWTLAALTTLTTLALAGAHQSASAQSAAAQPAAAQAPALSGITWTLVLTQQDGRTFAPVGAGRPTLRLDGRTASGSAGCNTYRGAYASRADVLRFGPLATTRRACAAAVGAGETRFLNLMGQVTGYQLSGQTLTLFAGPRDRLTFRAGGAATTPPEATVSLNGSWQLAGGTALRPLAENVPSLTFAGNQVSGSAGCNRLTGSVQAQAGRVTFGPLATTRRACAPAVNAQESAFLRFLGESSLRASVQGQTLTLTAASGRTLVFRRVGSGPANAAPTPATLLGQAYTLAAVGGRPVAASQPVTLAFGEGRLGGSDGCNQYGAPYRLEGATLVLTGEPVSTLRACPGPSAPVNLPALLASRPTLTVTATGLTLRAGETTLTFTRN